MFKPIDGSEDISYEVYEVDLNGFTMPNRFYRKTSYDYQLMLEKYKTLANKPRFSGEVIPLGVEYGNRETFTGD